MPLSSDDLLAFEPQVQAWIASRGYEKVARAIVAELTRSFGVQPRAQLFSDDDGERPMLALVVSVAWSPEVAVNALFEFTGRVWWAEMHEAMGGEIVVDVETSEPPRADSPV